MKKQQGRGGWNEGHKIVGKKQGTLREAGDPVENLYVRRNPLQCCFPLLHLLFLKRLQLKMINTHGPRLNNSSLMVSQLHGNVVPMPSDFHFEYNRL